MVLITRVTAPEEGLIYTTSVQLKIAEKLVGSGTLYISQSALAWQPDNASEGISIQWKQVSVHGISSNPTKCIYFMLDHALLWRGVYEGNARPIVAAVANGHNGGGDAGAPMQQGAAQDDEDEGNATDEDDGQDEDEEQMTECWLIPEDVNTVDTMFQAMTECQALHPDSADSISEESDFMDDDGEEDVQDNGAGLGPAAANDDDNGGGDAAAAQGGMQNLNINDNRFVDAEE